MDEEKNIKNPAVMAELFELSSCTSGLVPESKLSHKPQAQYDFVPKLSHFSGKNNKNSFLVTFTCGRRMFFMFFPLLLSAVCLSNPLMARSVCESLLSGTNERGSNEGRRPQTVAEGFLRFLLQPKLK